MNNIVLSPIPLIEMENLINHAVKNAISEVLRKQPQYVSETHLERRLINETCADFIDFANDNLTHGEYAPSKLLSDFREYSHSNKNLSAQKFGVWVKKYCEARNMKLEKTTKLIENRAVKYYIIS